MLERPILRTGGNLQRADVRALGATFLRSGVRYTVTRMVPWRYTARALASAHLEPNFTLNIDNSRATNDNSESKWRPTKRTRNPPPRSSPRARDRYRITRRRPASTTLRTMSLSPRRYVHSCDSIFGTTKEEDEWRCNTVFTRVALCSDICFPAFLCRI